MNADIGSFSSSVLRNQTSQLHIQWSIITEYDTNVGLNTIIIPQWRWNV